MTRILLTGASGFIASHILEKLLARGYSVRFTVRSEDKAQKLLAAHSSHASQLDYVLVPDIVVPGAFDAAVQSDPPFDGILHTASPFHFNVTDPQKQLMEPAIQGTVGILQAAQKYAPSVKRIVITSSFAAIFDAAQGSYPGKTYTEADWNPITWETGLENPLNGYRASKKLAEKAAWEFVEREKPGFDIATINPPMVFGPPKPYISSLESLNTSNERTLNFIRGKCKQGLPHSGVFLWTDVREVAEAHILAFEKPDAANKRFLISSNEYFSNQMIVDIIAKCFPEYADQFPEVREPNDGLPEEGCYKVDNSRSREILGMSYRPLEECVRDLVVALKEMGL
ncbi:ketoreductase [Morchella conica CCBAS932]|uniref:Ketoreductase n=1 Tax=Morchella conica CCBAS932 TaxID=1392247 RepID=A0A3N4L2C0_9PEZI|nr:ketoreductase [Morchella conica CCBAS932]